MPGLKTKIVNRKDDRVEERLELGVEWAIKEDSVIVVNRLAQREDADAFGTDRTASSVTLTVVFLSLFSPAAELPILLATASPFFEALIPEHRS